MMYLNCRACVLEALKDSRSVAHNFDVAIGDGKLSISCRTHELPIIDLDPAKLQEVIDQERENTLKCELCEAGIPHTH